MTSSPMQIAANRRNALKSRGPRTFFGKLKSSRNARRHGLSVQSALTEDVRRLARAILEMVPIERRTPALDNWAHLIAQAEFDIERVRAAKRDIYRQLPMQHGHEEPRTPVPAVSTEAIGQAVAELRKIDRYEKRALSRRRKAALTFRSHVREAAKRG